MGPSPQVIGYVQQPCLAGGFTPRLNIYEQENGKMLGYVEGPCCFIGGICCDSTFNVFDSQGSNLGQITRKGVKDFGDAVTKLFSDSDKYAVSFPPTTDVRMKATLFSTVLFLDYIFFEDEGAVSANPFDQSCSIKCCDVYCCGSTIPCKCTCGGDNNNNNNGGYLGWGDVMVVEGKGKTI